MKQIMRWGRFQSGAVGLILTASVLATAAFVPASAQQTANQFPEITINRFKVASGDQYVELKNYTDHDVPMSDIQLVYYNDYDLAAATSSKIITLSGTIPANGYYVVTDSTQQLCYQSVVASASLGFATGSGQMQLVRWEQNPGQPFGFTTLDAASWYRKSSSKSPDAPAGVVLFESASKNPEEFALRSWKDEHGAEVPRNPAGGSWQVAKLADGACQYEVAEGVTGTLEDEDFVFLAAALPPVRFVAAVSEGGVSKANRNVGKMAPVINEVLPNPASPQTDADDEFIEIYNPNESVFDLSGFKLAFGSTNPKRYTFPEGTLLQPKKFKVFTSGDTSISLSNTAAQVWLLDPNEKVIGQSESYSKAKDGQAWALDSTSGKWVWTLQPTPGNLNALTGAAGGTGTVTTAKAVLGISDSGASASGSGQTTTGEAATLADKTPVHPAVLAVVGLGALAYAIYEYRQDLSNKLFQLRRNYEHRRALRQKVSRR